jgi:hypothetical protein
MWETKRAGFRFRPVSVERLAKFTGIIANIFADPPGEPLAAKALHQIAVIKTITRGGTQLQTINDFD